MNLCESTLYDKAVIVLINIPSTPMLFLFLFWLSVLFGVAYSVLNCFHVVVEDES